MHLATGAYRSPQVYKKTSSAPSSDEITNVGNGSGPQRPPRQSRQRSESTTSSPTITGAQYYQHFQAQQQPQDPYYAPSSNSSPRPSPRSTPNTYGMGYPPPSQVPPSPGGFQLPPSALSISTREDSIRSASISYNQQQYQTTTHSSSSSYRSPHMSPGLPSSNGNMSMMPPPLTLPDSFLEDQSDYAGYYASDVGILSSPQLLPNQHQLPTPMSSGSLISRQQQSSHYLQTAELPVAPSRHSSRGAGNGGNVFLPSPHMTPTTSPLQIDFPSLSLNGKIYYPPRIRRGVRCAYALS